MTDRTRIYHIVSKLLEPILGPPKPPPKARKSFRGMKVGDHVQLEQHWLTPELGHVQPGSVFKVTSCTTEAATLLLVLALAPRARVGASTTWHRDWSPTFTKVGKRKLKTITQIVEESARDTQGAGD